MRTTVKNAIILLSVGAMISSTSAVAAISLMPSNAEDAPKAVETAEAEFSSPLLGEISGAGRSLDIALCWAVSEGFAPLDVPMESSLQEFIYYLCDGYGISFPLVMAIISNESGFQSDAVSADGHDLGLMQIRDSNFDWLSENARISDLQNPYDNVRAGIFVLKLLFDKYDDVNLVLMAYNMGEGGAGNLWSHGIYETVYSKKIVETARGYQDEIETKK